MSIAIAATVSFALLLGIFWGGAIERDRRIRFPVPVDDLPVAKATWKQRRALRRNRADLQAVLRRSR